MFHIFVKHIEKGSLKNKLVLTMFHMKQKSLSCLYFLYFCDIFNPF